MSTLTSSVSSAPQISRVASSPSRCGIRMSIRMTSGRSFRASATASVPSLASPTTSRSGAESTSTRKPPRTSAWSSATTTRITRPPPRSGSWAAHAEAAVRPGTGGELPAEHRDPLAHADDPVPGAGPRRRDLSRLAGPAPWSVTSTVTESGR